MSCVNIAKKLRFVTIFFVFAVALAGCKYIASSGLDSARINKEESAVGYSADYEKPQIIGTIKSGEITESSGLVESRCNRDVFWTHNDSGDASHLYALSRAGAKLGTFRVPNAKSVDWEDIATFKNARGECYLLIGDIGNNNLDRERLVIYLVKEPIVAGANGADRAAPLLTEAAESIAFSYADAPHNAETLMVHPAANDIYILTKNFDAPAGVYKLSANYRTDAPNRAEKIADLSVPAVPNGLLTGGEIAPDGKRLVICDYADGYEVRLPENSQNFDDIWQQKPVKFDLGERRQGEAVAYSADGKTIYATSEKKNSPIISVIRK